MKRISYLIIVGVILIIMNSCKKSSDTGVALEIKTGTISLGAGYANEIYLSLSDGLATTVPRNNWDIAFSVPKREAAILANTTSGVVLKAYPVPGSDWATPVDTTGFKSWTTLYNSDTTWSEGAFNMNATGNLNLNYGWGEYDINTHNLTGVCLYIIKTRGASYKKIWIDNKLSTQQKYTFRYADLDGSNPQIINLDLAGSNKNFMYYSLDTKEEVDREPDKDKWDILFTKYHTLIDGLDYVPTGVLQNIGVTAQISKDTDPESKVFPSTGFLKEINTIGYDWKDYDFEANKYTIKEDSCVFFVKDLSEAVYRIKFNTFEGSTTGNISFDVSILR
jgi:hypothetical protein